MGDGPVDVSVVIVNWNGADDLERCLTSLDRHWGRRRVEVVVVDNASDDHSCDVVRRHPSVRLIENATNVGLAAGNNIGIRASESTHVLISNPDIIYGPGSVDALVDAMERRPAAGMFVARHLREDGSVQTAAGDLPTLGDALLGRQIVRRRRADGSDGTRALWWDGWAHDRERRIGHGLEACQLVRRAAIEDVGLQDEGFRLDWEGIDWAERMHRKGWEIWFCPDAEVVHLGGSAVRQAPGRWVLRSHRGMYRYFALRSPRWARPGLAVLFGARALVKLVGLRIRLASYERSHPGTSPR